MELTVQYFGGLRERLGVSRETIDIADTARVGDLWEALAAAHPQLISMESFVRVAVNRDFADNDQRLSADDEIALLPPVSGGADQSTGELSDETGAYRITDKAVSTADVRAHVERPEAGAIVVFEGVVRDHSDDHAVSRLEYETYLAMALDKLVETANQVAEGADDCRIAIHHRYGTLEVGQTAVAIAVSCPHRAAAFEACQQAIDRLKEVVPIWKKEVGPDGQAWVGMGP